MAITINKRPIPATNELLPVVGLGTWQTFDVAATESELTPLRDVLSAFVNDGGSVIDSSPMYGRAEETVGTLASELSLQSRLFVATKVWTTGKENGIKQMEQSLQYLNRKKADLIQIHNLTDWKIHLSTLRSWKDDGRIRYLGITHYTESAYAFIEEILKKEPIDFLQINYSIVSRKAESRILPLAREKNVAVLINRPFEEGALFQRAKNLQFPEWATEFDCSSWAQFFLKFILANDAVTCVIPATDKKKHLIDNMKAGLGGLPTSGQRTRMIELFS